jgi:hypothetical protein
MDGWRRGWHGLTGLLVVLLFVGQSDGYVPNRTVVTLDVLGDGRNQLDLDLDHPMEEEQEEDDNIIQRR